MPFRLSCSVGNGRRPVPSPWRSCRRFTISGTCRRAVPYPNIVFSAPRNRITLFGVELTPIRPTRQTLPLRSPSPPPISML